MKLQLKHSPAPLSLKAHQLASSVTAATSRWMYAPGGVHTISPGAGEGSAELTLRIDAATADVLTASLNLWNQQNAPQRAFFDREHNPELGATGWPKRFVWSETPMPGVYVEVEPSALGRELIEGKIVRAFSPSIFADADLPKRVAKGQHVTIAAGKRGSKDNPARITGLSLPACGTLTNDPAFRKIQPLFAHRIPGAGTAETVLLRNIKPEEIKRAQIEVAREDVIFALRAYERCADPKLKAKLYAKEIAPRLRAGEDLPIHAANTLGTLAGELIAQNALELLTTEQPLLSAISTDFSAEPAKLNQEINSRIVGTPATSDYDENNGYQTENTLATDVPLTITAHKSCQVKFNANELGSTSRKLFQEFAPAMAYAVAKEFVDAALAIMTADNFDSAPIDEALIDFDRESVIAIGGALSDRGVPATGRSLLLKGSYYDKLFSDEAVVTLAARQRPDLITGNQLVPLHGFNVLRAATLPDTGNLVGFGCGKSAVVIAGRLPNDYASALPGADGGGTVQVITEPKTGLSVQLVQFVDHKLGAAFARMAFMFGAAKGQAAAGQIIRSAAP